MIGLFGSIFVALDWSEKEKQILVFETFKDDTDKVDTISSNSNNTILLMYSQDSHNLMHISRDKSIIDREHVLEDWNHVRLSGLPAELGGKRIVSHYIKES